MLFRGIKTGYIIHGRHAELRNLFRHRFRVVDDRVSAEVNTPSLCFRPRCRSNDVQLGQMTGNLQQNGTHTSSSTCDQDATFAAIARDEKSIEEKLPCCQCRQGESRGLAKVERLRLLANNPLIDEMKLGVRSWAGNRSRIEHLISRLEQCDLSPNCLDDPGSIPAKDFVLPFFWFGGRS